MSIHLENEFAVPTDADGAWAALVDIPLVAGCVPGASIESRDPDGSYRGKVGLSLGPVSVEYDGRIEVVRQDDHARVLSLRAEGRDGRGQGTVNASFTLHVEPDGATTRARLVTDVDVTGRVAQFGRGIMEQVARRIVAQFSTNLARLVGDSEAAAATAPPERGTWTFAAAAGVTAGALWFLIRRRLR